MLSGIAILGSGIFAKEAHLPSLAELGKEAPALKAIYSRSQSSARELADIALSSLNLSTAPAVYYDSGNKSTDLDALLARSDIDAVIVVLPISLQPSIVLKALSAGKHVLSEKPVAPDVAQGIELINKYNSLYKPKGLIWRVAENFEAEPGFRAAAEAISSGKIGKVNFFQTVVYHHVDQESKWYKTPWRTVPDYQGGFLLDGGVHTAAALRVMLPHQLTHLSGFASLNKDYLAPYDTINTIVRAGSQFHGTIEMTFASPTKARPGYDGFLITGSEGWMSVNRSGEVASGAQVLRVVIKSKKDGDPDKEQEEVIDNPFEGVKVELASFFDAIRQKSGNLDIGQPLEALRDVALIEAALKSDGQLIDLFKLVPPSL